ncbi:MAG: ATP-binding protein [Lachnospiraceae bacterium]|nr:ATP-binding protein [Lachnospiraceae bacterium]
MGYYLNPEDVLELYRGETEKPYFVDKTGMLSELIMLLEQGRNYISVTRPRRFGKSVVAAMIGSFFGKGADSSDVFAHLKISGHDGYEKHMNQHNLIYIDFSRDVAECSSYKEYIDTIKMRLLDDLKESYPDAKIRERDSLGAALRLVSLAYKNEKFLLIFDEWDYIFHKNYFTESDRGKYTAFLGDMTKGRAYVEMAYLTGVLPIKKYSASDTMNHFAEYNMANSIRFREYFGFTNAEVDELYQRYLKIIPASAVSREDLTNWYDGYHKEGKESIYNPNSVVMALTENMISDYWPKAGEYEELKDYVLNDIDGVREAVMLLVAGEPVKANISEYATTAPVLKRRNEIFSAMTVYGYLNYYNGCVRIPNRELWEEFDRIIQEEPKYSYMRELEKESARILQATYDGDEDTVGKVLAIVHTTESPLKAYRESLAMQNRASHDGSACVHDSRWKSWTCDEAELSGSVKLAYIAARNKYNMEREDQAGIGYVDYIFYPYNRSDDGIIIELKVDDSPETALQQIKDKNYALKFQGKMGEQPKTTGRIILVGIGYYRKDKVHRCRIEVL